MLNFRGFIHELVYSTRAILYDEILFKSMNKSRDIPLIPWDRIHENPLDNSPDSNFLNNPLTQIDLAADKWLTNRINRYNNLLRQFEIPGE